MSATQEARLTGEARRPLVSVVLPAYNEEAIIAASLDRMLAYLPTLEDRYEWELLVVNDGSRDRTGEIADAYAREEPRMRVLHHPVNFGLGQAFQYAFSQCRGDYIVTLDADLSYAPEHVGRLLEAMREKRAKIVLASPYMRGGRISNVPFLRRVLSVGANRFLALLARGHLSTFTSMARAYDGDFIRALSLRATDMVIMPETIYKAMLLHAKVEQIPAHLDWQLHHASAGERRSSMSILRHMLSTILSGFIFRPFVFFVLPGLLLLAFALWVNTWMVVHFFEAYAALGDGFAGDRIGAAIAQAYRDYPHTFIVGLLSLMLSVQLVSLGILSLQSKTYFEEMFYLGSATRDLRRSLRQPRGKAGEGRETEGT